MLAPLASVPLLLAAAFQDFEVGPVPDWVRPLELPEPAPAPPGVEGELEYLVIDTQCDARTAPRAWYFETTMLVRGRQGVSPASQYEVGFDPSCQRVVLHAAEVLRDGVALDRLVPEEVRVFQREPGLEQATFDGLQTVSLLLEDVRPGDVVRYRYSRIGDVPSLEGRIHDVLPVGIGPPVRRIQRAYLLAPDRRLHVRPLGGAPRPVEELAGEGLWVRWLREDVKASPFEPSVPEWHAQVPLVEVSDFGGWDEVVAWALPLWEVEGPLEPALEEEVLRVRAIHVTLEERAEALVRFVREGIRYTALGFGEGGYRPEAPARVLARRYGDCKDQALLLARLLGALGLEAHPALVSTTARHTLADSLPSPSAFDHAIVRLRLGARTLWIDPTDSEAQGRLLEQEPPWLGWALVLREAETGLEEIPRHVPERTTLEWERTIRCGEAGEAARVWLLTRAYGREADGLRAMVALSGVETTTRQYHAYYAEDQASAESLGPIRTEDDREANVYETLERYRVPAFWEQTQEGWLATTCARELALHLPFIGGEERRSPLRLPHPAVLVFTTRIETPFPWSIQPETTTEEGPGFRYERDVRVDPAGPWLTIRHELRTLDESIEAVQVPRYTEALDRVRQLACYSVVFGGTDGAGPFLAYGAGAAGLILGLLALMVLRATRGALTEERVVRLRETPLVLAVWRWPRIATRVQLGRGGQSWVLGVVMVVSVGRMLGQSMSSLPAPSSTADLVGSLMGRALASCLVGVFLFGIQALVVRGLGRILRGRGTLEDVCVALGVGLLPEACGVVLWLPLFLLLGPQMFEATRSVPIAAWREVAAFAVLGLDLALTVWTVFTLAKALAEALGFSAWRGFLAIFLGPLLFVLVVAVAGLAVLLQKAVRA